ncbi:unnamed protein product (macronuclear) [Paramecium tetraurelia]|uniref:CHHC U11-48K-type domain-containing protein n=1 Tax=Paramecium tetraurelia TaxID=5888 RepID=A0E626_PARTE|nr:uncharacterized protein GSPATT00003606001 [Paramecium tetraurelia]CAK90743.1 unnamed protein product [Paramecium tetraurelia]|eukprot:XP_001458140.1 hypothetical protein (macronuclear) [Paramecium tetraurelia strain d4-2]
MSIETIPKYQAFNMSNDYRAPITCPYGCTLKLVEEQLLLHVTKCWRQDDSLYGHCKYNYLHIYPYSQLPFHEQNCTSNIPMTEEDFAYKPDPNYNNVNLDWIQDELSLQYAKYFAPIQDQISMSSKEQSNQSQPTSSDQEKQPEEFDQQQNVITSDGETEKDLKENECKTEDPKNLNFTEIQLQNQNLNDSDKKVDQLKNGKEHSNKPQYDHMENSEAEKSISKYIQKLLKKMRKIW